MVGLCACGKKLYGRFGVVGRCRMCELAFSKSPIVERPIENVVSALGQVVEVVEWTEVVSLESTVIVIAEVAEVYASPIMQIRELCQTLLAKFGEHVVSLPAIIAGVSDLFKLADDEIMCVEGEAAETNAIAFTPFTISMGVHNELRTLVDVVISKYGCTFVYSGGEILIDTSVMCRQHEHVPYETGRPVGEGVIPFVNVKLADYKPTGGYNSFPSSVFDRQPLSVKTILDNEYKFAYGRPDLVFYDIETANVQQWNKVPMYADKDSAFIGIVSVVHLVGGQLDQAILHIIKLNQHVLDVTALRGTLGFTPLDIQVHSMPNDRALAYEFFRILNAITNLSICIGFNSSSSMRLNSPSIGYDLPWLMNRSACTLKKNVRRCKIGGIAGCQISKIDELPKVYFADMAVLARWALSPGQTNAMESFKLDEYLLTAGVPQKQGIVSYYDLQKRLATKNANITDLVSYCAYDSFALALLNEKMGALNKILSIGALLNVPLSNALYNTQAKNIEMSLQRKFIAAGYNIVYSPLESAERYQGAYTFLDTTKMGQILSNVASPDVVSMYPTSLRSGNLSPETLCKAGDDRDSKQFDVSDNVISDTVDGKITYKFLTRGVRPGVVPVFLDSLLLQRKQVKNKMRLAAKGSDEHRAFDVQQYAIKIVMNSIYGLLGSGYSALYSKPCAVTCTYLGRTCLHAIENTFTQLTGRTPLAMDTDSLMGCFDSTEQIAELAALVKVQCGDEFDLINEDTYVKYCPSKAKKSYFALKDTGELVIKGISWSKYTQQAKADIRGLFRTILESGNMVSSIRAFYTHHWQAIQEAIIMTNWRELLAPYASIVKLSGKNAVAAELVKRYAMIDDIAYTVEVKAANKHTPVRELVRILTDTDLKACDINVTKLMRSFMSSISKLTIKFADMEAVVDYETMVHYRVEQWTRGSAISQERDLACSVVEFLEMSALSLTTNRALHEVFLDSRPYRLFIDIDKSNRESAMQCKEAVSYVLGVDQIEWAITENGGSSFHMISNVVMPIRTMATLMAFIKESSGLADIDLGVYGVGKCLRFINCPKLSITTGAINKTSVHRPTTKVNKLGAYVISNLDKTIAFKSMQYSCTAPFDTGVSAHGTLSDIDTRDAIAWMVEIGLASYTMYTPAHMIVFAPNIKQAFKCPLCGWAHATQRWGITVSHDKLNLKCFGTPTKRLHKDRSNVVKFTQHDRIAEIIANVKKEPAFALHTINSGGDLDIPFPTERIVCIKSCVGTGKTKWVSRYIDTLPAETRIVWVSFRRSFSADVSHKCGFENYMDIKGALNMADHPRIVVQTDSLHRLSFEGMPPQLIIFDEATSIFEQMESALNKNKERSYQLLHRLVIDSKQVIAMDALLPASVVDLLSEMCDSTDVRHVINEYKPNQRHIDMYVGLTNDICGAVLDNVELLPMTAKIAIFSTGTANAQSLDMALTASGRRVLCLHGADIMAVEKGDTTELMIDLKARYFSNPESIFAEHDVFIYTSTMTAGISIELTKVDLMIGVYSRNTCSPIGFVQGMGRVRNQAKTIIFHVAGSESHEYPSITPCHQTGLAMSAGVWDVPWRAVTSYALAMIAQSHVMRDELLIKFLVEDNGYDVQLHEFDGATIEFEKLAFDYVQELFESKYIPSAQDMSLYELMGKHGDLTAETKLMITKDTIKTAKWIDMLACYGFGPTTIYSSEFTLAEVQCMFSNRYAYRKAQALNAKFEYKDVSADYDRAKHDAEISKIRGLLARVIDDKKVVGGGLSIDYEVKTQKTCALINAIKIFAEPFAGGQMTSQAFDKFCLESPEVKRMGGLGAYSIKSINSMIKSYNYEIRTRKTKVNQVATKFVWLMVTQDTPIVK